MCGAPKEQKITQKTELDPALRRYLYGGTIANPRGGFGGSVAPVETKMISSGDDSVGYAYGGPVMPQQGIGSLNRGQMPMMNGQFPNLSDPMTAATLAMAVRSPQMRYGDIMGGQMNGQMGGQMGYARGGFIQGPGTGTSDSIPAKIYQDGVPVKEAALSDGEFVMTKRAVDGAGGAANMYAMMKKFERGGSI